MKTKTEPKTETAKHTPGPWETGCLMSKVQVNPPGWNQPMFIADCDVAWGPATEDEKCANAQLIAAAPELLDALTDLVGGCGKEGDLFNGAAMEKARSAIAKAEGRAT